MVEYCTLCKKHPNSTEDPLEGHTAFISLVFRYMRQKRPEHCNWCLAVSAQAFFDQQFAAIGNNEPFYAPVEVEVENDYGLDYGGFGV